MFFFNNSNRRNFPDIYGIADAFYDLQIADDDQREKATTFAPGAECIVATTIVKDREIRFTRFRLARVEIRHDEHGRSERVFCGPALQSETLSKSNAAANEVYSVFFNKNGHFKKQMVLER